MKLDDTESDALRNQIAGETNCTILQCPVNHIFFIWFVDPKNSSLILQKQTILSFYSAVFEDQF